MFNKKDKQETPSTDNMEDVNNAFDSTEENENPLADELNANEPVEASAESKLKDELAQANDKYLRLYAEFDNFRRRTNKERAEERQTAGKDTIVALLPVVDDFDRALKAMESTTDINAVKEGVSLVFNKLKNMLAQKGLKPMDAKGTEFDADLHEAITNVPAPTEDLKGKVVDELEKGYYLNDKVVRFAKVVVGS
ncbi:nucleotide exchange factor GrpE [Mucilaginibacter robiniae]|uniref:Protein GrpE n=2 Tax=Mucilaginibacter robiniae TaxID=2728022 RepID=A0A7L5E598_9SPHI|nr:nucleotide exchange factor GrpE [Mucilaginibacter robiniae]